MKKNNVSEKMIEIRKRKGFSQDELAERACISLRTVQRIENGETDPHGHTLSVICKVLDVNIEDIVDYGKVEDKTFLSYFHLSVLTGVIIPLGDIIVPLILWLSKRDKVVGLSNQGKNLLMFRVCFDFLLFLIIVSAILFFFMPISESVFDTSSTSNIEPNVNSLVFIQLFFIICHLIVSFIYPIYVAISIQKSKKLKSYYPRFFK